MSKVIIIGGGASGMIASIFAARNGNEVTLLEKNEKLGKKLYITGKGRCNLTNACDKDTFFSNIVSNPRFLYSAYATFDNQDTMDFFEELGLEIKVERGNRVFPESDHSSDVIRVLEDEMKQLQVKVRFHTTVASLIIEDLIYKGVQLEDGGILYSDACIIATGGLSYPSTGSTGDGYRLAKSIGHTVTKLIPSLVSIIVKEDYVKELEGLSLKNVELTMTQESKESKEPEKGKEVFRDFGEMLFTRNGVSGPLILSASSRAVSQQGMNLKLHIDLKPALTFEQLDARILRDFEEVCNKQFRNALGQLLPIRLVQQIVALSGIDPYKQVNQVTQEERHLLTGLIKNLEFGILKLGGYNEAVITRGGITVKEINPSTMESKLVPGVYFTGELLDLDAVTGGYNLQIAWSTGHAAGSAIY